MRRDIGLRRGVSLSLGLLAGACWTGASPVRAEAPVLAAESYMVVDCLLPGQVRKLGRSTTFLTPRRPIRTSGVNCEIRGGEYVAADRADFASSLAVWLPSAQGGDAKAQAYVGRIYADGLGRAPDYAQAAAWYQKASDQGYAQAMIDLGQLYERGQGVAQDQLKAVNLYRKASGLPPSTFASAQAALAPDPTPLARLNAQYEAARADAQGMAGELAAAKTALAQERTALAEARARLERASTAPKPVAAPAPKAGPSAAEMAAMQKVVSEKAAQLDAANARSAQLTADLAKAKAAAAQRTDPLAAQLKAVQAERTLALQQRDQTQQALTALRAQAAGQSKPSAAAEAKLARAQAELNDRDARLAASEARLSGAEQRIAAVRAESARQMAPMEQQLRGLQTASAGLQRERDQALAQVQSLTARAAASDASRLTAEAEKAKAEQALAAARAALADRETQLQKAKADLSAAGSRPSPQATAMQQRLAQMQRDYDGATQRSAELAAKVASLESQSGKPRPASPDLAAREAKLAAREAKVAELEGKLASALKGYRNATPVSASASVGRPVRMTASSKFGFGGSYAILIGESNYRDAKLPKLATPKNDVSQIGDMLQNRYGFTVKVMLDKSRAEILHELDEVSQKLTENDTLVIYYAGHGGMEKVRNGADRGYWLPVDAEYGSSASQISNQEITYQVARMAARKVLIVADSCYSGLLTQTVTRAQRPANAEEKSNDYLIGMAHKQSRNVLTSGGLEPVLDGGGAKNHSVFAAALLSILQSNNDVITSEELYGRLVTQVMSTATSVLLKDKDVPDPQQPQYSALDNGGHVYGDFLFVPKSGV